MLDRYINQDGKRLRLGYTSGSTATGATKAAAIMLETGEKPARVEIETPAGIDLDLEVIGCEFKDGGAVAGVVKDAGDDPDSTHGIKIYSFVKKRKDGLIKIDGGLGIGRIVSKGLFGEIGEAAINPVPKKMMEKELRKVSDSGYDVLIYAPEGVEIGKKTFNKNIGIEGGISIIGTKGIVYPMSVEALVKTIQLEIDGVRARGEDKILFVLGNYGEDLAKKEGINLPAVKVSNYIGEALSHGYFMGFRDFTIVGHIGKLSKLSLGIFNTHNRVADTRLEAFVYYLYKRGISFDLAKELEELVTGEEAAKFLDKKGLSYIIGDMEVGCQERIKRYLKDDSIRVRVRIYSMDRGFFTC